MRIAIVGAGTIGERRAQAMPKNCRVAGIMDTNEDRAWKLAQRFRTKPYNNLENLLASESINAAIIATVNSAIVPAAQACLDRGIPVLLEKPAARNFHELQSLHNPKNLPIKIGFNHRFHPAYEDLLLELARNPKDPIMFIRARYGNGARVDFDKEWRSDASIAGGGELMDQGVHVLDLAGRILSGLEVKAGYSKTHYWKMSVDDNSWAILSSAEGQTFEMHVSSSEWKNEFQFDVYTRNRKYVWHGLGRSYGPETLTIYKMKPEMGPPDIEKKEYPGEDLSWLKENQNFVDSIRGEAQLNGDFDDAVKSLKLVSDIYQKSKELQGTGDHPKWY